MTRAKQIAALRDEVRVANERNEFLRTQAEEQAQRIGTAEQSERRNARALAAVEAVLDQWTAIGFHTAPIRDVRAALADPAAPASDYTCPTDCVEQNHPGQEHAAWLEGERGGAGAERQSLGAAFDAIEPIEAARKRAERRLTGLIVFLQGLHEDDGDGFCNECGCPAAECLYIAALADPAGALATHDAEVLPTAEPKPGDLVGALKIPAAARLRVGELIRVTGPGSWELEEDRPKGTGHER